MVNNMQRATVLGALPKLPDALQINDLNDAFLVAMAIGSEADYVVTGDWRAGLLQLGAIGRTRFVTPAIFCAEEL
jgi:predicted nucleic acid-binding protein